MNRPPGPGSSHDPDPDPDTPWYLRRPVSDDHTRIARLRPNPPRPAPPRRYPSPIPPDVGRSPNAYRPPPRPPVTPWYQRPDRPVSPATTPPKPPRPAGTAAREKLARQLLIGGGIVAMLIAAAVLFGAASKLVGAGGKVLNVAKIQVGVQQTLSDPAGGYGANTVSDVSCNHGRDPSADKGTTFTCDAIVNGIQHHVTVLVSDDDGTYEIDAPR